MTRPPISFRFTEHEFTLLESNQLAGESLSQTAARLLRDKLGLPTGSNEKLEDKTLDSFIEDKVNQYVDERVNAIIERIEKLETKPRSPRRSPIKQE